jgi:hypothetical protein
MFFMPVTISFTDPVPMPDGFLIAYRRKGTSDDYEYEEVAGGSPITLNYVSNFQDYEGTIQGVCSGFYGDPEVWETNNFNTVWTVTDEWYVCWGQPCDGVAVYCTYFTVRRQSDDFLVYSYTYDEGGRSRTAHLPTLEVGVAYVLEAEWFADEAKTTGFDTVSLTGNATSTSWTESGTGYVTHSITFVGVAGENVISVVGTVGAPDCTCPPYAEFTLPVSNSLGSHCSVGSWTNMFVPNDPGFITPGIPLFTNSALTTPLTGWSYISDVNGEIFNVNSSTGVVGANTGEVCLYG